MDGGATEADHWREIAAQKEKEWKEVTEQRIWTLETACQEKEKLLSDERSKFQKLKEDFKYNLKLLAERDQELDRYDASFSDLKAQLNVKNAEISECKIELDEMRTQFNCEQKSREELQLHYQARVREKQAEIDSYKTTKDGELKDERKEFESFKRKLQRQLTELEEEKDAQKRELTTSFEEAMRKREHEFHIQADEMSAKVLEYELKAKLLGKELELVRTAQEKNSQEFEKVETNHRALEKRLKGKDWELEDLKAMKDAAITDLQNQLQQTESTLKRQQLEHDRKHQEMDKYCREKEGALTAAKDAFSERESELQNTIRDLQSKLEDNEVAKRQLQWASQDLEKEKNSYINKLQEEIQQLKEKWDKQIVEVSRSQVNKDLELQNVRETEEKLKAEIMQKKEDIERYKKELSLSVEREAGLERSKTQVELDWQRRYEDLERQHYEKSEDFIKKITRSRDEALATVKEKERELQQRETLIRALKTDREHAMATLKHHGIKMEKNVNVTVDDSQEDVTELQEQNNNLRAVIKEMRDQMEQLGHHIPDVNLKPQRGDKITEDYVRGLEKDVRELRQKNREMEQDADVARRFGRHPTTVPTDQAEVMAEVKDNFIVKTHIQSLNDLIGSLKAEKLELSAQVKKHQAHIQYQEQTIDKMGKEQREKQVELDQIQYEIGAVNRRSQTEIASLRQRISELELQLVEARKEADEYYKGTLERNMEVVALGQEVSGLKMELAQKRPAINYGAQELLIQQLQDEIKHLRDAGADFSVSSDHSKPANVQIKNLQQKLKGAAKKISELAKERQQLIEIGNKLRAELKAADAGADFSVSSDHSKPANVQIKNLQQKLKGAAKKISELAKERQQLIEIGNKLRAELKAAAKHLRDAGADFSVSSDHSKPANVQIKNLQQKLKGASKKISELAKERQQLIEIGNKLRAELKTADSGADFSVSSDHSKPANVQIKNLQQKLKGAAKKISELAKERQQLIEIGNKLRAELKTAAKHLRDAGADFSVSSDHSKPANVQIKNLQQKLKGAAKKISELAKERQQLIEIGNKLRAELKAAGVEVPMTNVVARRPPPPHIHEETSNMTNSQPLSEKFGNKLSQLEQLQYQLTRQELQFAQKYPTKQSQDNNLSDTEEYRPPSILKKPGAGLRDSMDTEVNVRASVNTEGGETYMSAQSVPTARSQSQLMMSMSSMGGESLQEIWKMLDEARPSPTPRQASPGYPQRDVKSAPPAKYHDRGDAGDSADFSIAGKQTGQVRGTGKQEKKFTNRMAGKVIRNTSQKPKIRNYNVRDDASIR